MEKALNIYNGYELYCMNICVGCKGEKEKCNGRYCIQRIEKYMEVYNMTEKGKIVLEKLMEGKSIAEAAKELGITRQAAYTIMHAKKNIAEYEKCLKIIKAQKENKINRMSQAREEGKTIKEIAKEFNVPYSRVNHLASKGELISANFRYYNYYRVGQEMKNKGITLRELAKHTSIPAGSLQMYLYGKIDLPLKRAIEIRDFVMPNVPVEVAFKTIKEEL